MVSSGSLAGVTRRSWRALCGAAMAAGLSLLGAADAGAEAARRDVYVELTPLSNAELRELRGGFKFGNLDFDFAAWVKVLINGQLVAHTAIVWNPAAGKFDQVDAGGTVAPPPGVTVSPFMQQGPVGLSGLKIDRDGQSKSSFALHDVNLQHTIGAVLNSISGTAGEAFKVQQTIETNLTINNFTALRAGLIGGAAVANLAKAGIPDAMFGH